MNDQANTPAETSRQGSLIIQETPSSLQISVRSVSGWIIFLTPVCVIWNITLGFFLNFMFRDQPDWRSIVSSLPFVFIGLALGYVVIVGMINRLTLRVTREQVSVRLGPLPWFGNWKLPAGELITVYYERCPPSLSRGFFNLYILKATTAGEKTLRMLDMIDGTLQADMVKEKVELHLGRKPASKPTPPPNPRREPRRTPGNPPGNNPGPSANPRQPRQ